MNREEYLQQINYSKNQLTYNIAYDYYCIFNKREKIELIFKQFSVLFQKWFNGSEMISENIRNYYNILYKTIFVMDEKDKFLLAY